MVQNLYHLVWEMERKTKVTALSNKKEISGILFVKVKSMNEIILLLIRHFSTLQYSQFLHTHRLKKILVQYLIFKNGRFVLLKIIKFQSYSSSVIEWDWAFLAQPCVRCGTQLLYPGKELDRAVTEVTLIAREIKTKQPFRRHWVLQLFRSHCVLMQQENNNVKLCHKYFKSGLPKSSCYKQDSTSLFSYYLLSN